MKPFRNGASPLDPSRRKTAPSQSGTVRSPHPPSAFQGDLAFIGLPELLQYACTGTRDSAIQLSSDNLLGYVIIQKGKVARCALGTMYGLSAFFELVKLRVGRFRVTPIRAAGPVDPVFTAYTWQSLLLEAARREDEAEVQPTIVSETRAKKSPVPQAPRRRLPSNDFGDVLDAGPPQAEDDEDDFDQRPTLLTIPREKSLGRLLDDATEAFLLHDYAHALKLYERCLAMDPDNRLVKMNIERVRWWLNHR